MKKYILVDNDTKEVLGHTIITGYESDFNIRINDILEQRVMDAQDDGYLPYNLDYSWIVVRKFTRADLVSMEL